MLSVVASAEPLDGGYAPLPGLQQAASLVTVSANEDSYIALYAYVAQVITKSASFSHTVIY